MINLTWLLSRSLDLIILYLYIDIYFFKPGMREWRLHFPPIEDVVAGYMFGATDVHIDITVTTFPNKRSTALPLLFEEKLNPQPSFAFPYNNMHSYFTISKASIVPRTKMPLMVHFQIPPQSKYLNDAYCSCRILRFHPKIIFSPSQTNWLAISPIRESWDNGTRSRTNLVEHALI